MITQLTQEAIAEYASDAQTIDEPVGIDYTQGVKVGRTVPAKWWNWLFRAATKRIEQSKTDAQNMLTELQNAVTDAGIALDGNDNTQLSQAITVNASTQIQEFIEAKKGLFTRWETVGASVTHNFQRSDWVWEDECCAYLVADSRHWNFKVFATNDFVSWVEHSISAGRDIQNQGITVAKFANKYFIMTARNNPSSVSNANASVELYTFDGAQFTHVFTDYGVDTLSNMAYYLPVMFVTEQRLGIIHVTDSSASTSNPFALRVRTTTDGINWTNTKYSSLAAYRNTTPGAVSALRPVRGYEFPDGIVVGNAVIGPSTITRLTTVNLTNWFPRTTLGTNTAITFKLNNTLVFKGDGNKIYTAPLSGNSPTVTEHTIAGITSYQLYNTLHDDSIVVIRDNNGHYQFSTDGYTFTDTGVTDTIYELNGVYFSGTKKSTDLTNWTELPIPAQYAGMIVTNIIEQVGAVIATGSISGTIVSLDLGETWVESSQPIRRATLPYTTFSPVGLPNKGATLFTLKFTEQGLYDIIMQAYATSNSVNAVIGHTLYLN